MSIYKEALRDILECNSLYIAKELAAEALDVDVQEYIDTPDDDSYYDADDDVNYEDVLKDFN
jgi:hypothetical protein